MENEFNSFASLVIFDHGYCADAVVGRLRLCCLAEALHHAARLFRPKVLHFECMTEQDSKLKILFQIITLLVNCEASTVPS